MVKKNRNIYLICPACGNQLMSLLQYYINFNFVRKRCGNCKADLKISNKTVFVPYISLLLGLISVFLWRFVFPSFFLSILCAVLVTFVSALILESLFLKYLKIEEVNK